MTENQSAKMRFRCIGCERMLKLLKSPQTMINGSVRAYIYHTCVICERVGRIPEGEKQIFRYMPRVRKSPEETAVVKGDEKYV